ncbi:hypothetical protein CR513_45529, partial [Mucuna pruriens]
MNSYCTSKRLHHGLPTSAIMWQHLSVLLKPRSIQSSNSATQHLEAATMDQLRLLGKCLIVGPIGPLFSETLINSSPPTTNVKKLEWP